MINFDPILIYLVIFITVALLLLCIAVTVLYIRLVNKFNDFKEGKEEKVDPQAVLQEAQDKSVKIIEEANLKSKDIISKAEVFLTNYNSSLKQELSKSTQIYVQKYQQALSLTQQESIKVLQNIPEDIKKVLIQEIASIRAAIQTEVGKAEVDARNLVVEAYRKAESEVANYKNERIKQVDDAVVMILRDVARKVLSKEISKEEHEKLVLKALDEARKENVFFQEEPEKESVIEGIQNITHV